MFDNIEEIIEKMAIILFWLLLVVGGICVIAGLIIMNDSSEYTGKIVLQLGFISACSSLSTLPLYGFGTLIRYVKSIDRRMKNLEAIVKSTGNNSNMQQTNIVNDDLPEL